MIWQYQDCMLCGQPMELSDNSDADDPIKLFRCPTMVKVPDNLYFSVKTKYLIDALSTHFEVEHQDHKPYHQVIRIFPFVLSAYDNCVNIAKYDNNLHLKFVAEVDALDLPWKETDKVLKKLATYTLFS